VVLDWRRMRLSLPLILRRCRHTAAPPILPIGLKLYGAVALSFVVVMARWKPPSPLVASTVPAAVGKARVASCSI
jgi:hypothetical protein